MDGYCLINIQNNQRFHCKTNDKRVCLRIKDRRFVCVWTIHYLQYAYPPRKFRQIAEEFVARLDSLCGRPSDANESQIPRN